MEYRWRDNKAEEYEIAAVKSGFFRNIVSEIILELGEDETKKSSFLDLACGTGILSRTLAPFAGDILSIDISEDAISFLKERMGSINNIKAVASDISDINLKEINYDYLILSYFGNPERDDSFPFINHANKGGIIVTPQNNKPEKKDSDARKSRLKHRGHEKIWTEFLAGKGFEYKVKRCSLDFSQPLKNMEEAVSFFKGFHEETAIPELLKTVTKTNDKEYPFEVKKTRDISIIFFKN
jgi:predicted RNA methylase